MRKDYVSHAKRYRCSSFIWLIGLTSYYCGFIEAFAQIAQPLHNLTQKGASFTWSPQCQAAFHQLKECLISFPVLHYLSIDKRFIIDTDSNQHDLGAILLQEQHDHKLHLVTYASWALYPTENYWLKDACSSLGRSLTSSFHITSTKDVITCK